MPKELTETQRKIFEFILERRRGAGMPPTLEEIAEAFGYRNRSTVRGHLKAIEKKGYINIEPNVPRGVTLAEEDLFETRPALGEAAAGAPLTLYPDAVDVVELPKIAHTPKDSFLLKITGDSLKDAYVFDGDVAIVHPNAEPLDGHIVVAVLDDGAVIKRFYRFEDRIELRSENPDYETIVLDRDYEHFEIVGVVVGVYRRMERRTT